MLNGTLPGDYGYDPLGLAKVLQQGTLPANRVSLANTAWRVALKFALLPCSRSTSSVWLALDRECSMPSPRSSSSLPRCSCCSIA